MRYVRAEMEIVELEYEDIDTLTASVDSTGENEDEYGTSIKVPGEEW